MNCPSCKEGMLILELDRVEIDWCAECGGVWLDEGELQLISGTATGSGSPVIKAASKDAPHKGSSTRRCPACSSKMVLVDLPSDPPVEIDRCPHGHGIWFDKGELETVVSSTACNDRTRNLVRSFFTAQNERSRN